MNAVYRADLNKLIALITKEGVDPTAVRDDRGFTALHIAALNDQLRIPTALVQHVSVNQVKDTSPEYASQLAFWVNQFSNDHFTCLHFAVFRGNKVPTTQELITLFIEIGADIAATNKQGLSVMHIAAQGDQPLSLALLHYQYGINYLGLDDKRSTALHWAAYLGSDQAAALLLAWDKEKHLIDEQDADGHTALHLAAISGNVKIVRTLLLHGADSKRSVWLT